MKKGNRIILIILFVGIAGFFVFQKLAISEINNAVFKVVPEKKGILEDIPFVNLKISSNDRQLNANFLIASERAPSFFICTGNAEALYEWKEIQVYLKSKGFSSFVFSYSGFGSSTGSPTIENLNQDILAAYKKYIQLTSESFERIALSHSLGSGPLLEMANKLIPAPSKLLVHAPFSSIREGAIASGDLPSSLSFLFPDVWNNMENASKTSLPLFLVHSRADNKLPFTNSEKIFKNAGNNAQLLLIDNYGHNAIYQNVNDDFMIPILNFINN
jgi:esterase/lipase